MGRTMQSKNAKANCLIKNPIGLHACNCACLPGPATAQKCNVRTGCMHVAVHAATGLHAPVRRLNQRYDCTPSIWIMIAWYHDTLRLGRCNKPQQLLHRLKSNWLPLGSSSRFVMWDVDCGSIVVVVSRFVSIGPIGMDPPFCMDPQ